MSELAPIPIANIYYLFLYAWNRFEEARSMPVAAEESPDLPNLLAKVLLAGMRTLVRRGLDRGYQPHLDDLPTVRGRIELNGSIALRARQTPRLLCSFDELSHDVLQNQIIKATMQRLSKASALDPHLAHLLRLAVRAFSGVSDVRLSLSAFGRVSLHRNNAYYDLLLKVCRLAYDLMLPESGGQGFAFQEVLRDEKRMARVFEDFVRNFYLAEQTTFEVKRLKLEWAAIPLGNAGQRLPSMMTDIYLESRDRRIIIDTKYYVEALQQYFHAPSYRSENLYQLFAYLKNDAARAPELPCAEGMLLYPQTGVKLDDRFLIQGHAVRLVTLDLAQPWQQIETTLKQLIR